MTETYIPLLKLLEQWEEERLNVRITLTLTPTLCSMLMDPLLQTRYLHRLDELIALANTEMQRTFSDRAFHELAVFYRDRLFAIREYFQAHDQDIVRVFRGLQERGRLEIITSA